uniref:Uncharacterized protein n=1 Tax=Anguilla anguilla TaxID=7936 RepID=A0A0E9QP84_ANGAN
MNSCCSRTPATIPTRATMPSGKSTSVGSPRGAGKMRAKHRLRRRIDQAAGCLSGSWTFD